MQDDFGDRMKLYEGREAQRRSMPRLPVLVRVDGKGFSKWTKGLKYPFDEALQELRVSVTTKLIGETNALLGYCQSDEITLFYYGDHIYCEGRYQKMVSHIASFATAFFNAEVPKVIPSKARNLAFFDARAWEVPSVMEAANAFLWREQDATKNSVSMAARSVYAHKELVGKTGPEMQEMLFQKGINWNDYPAWAKRGTFLARREAPVDFKPKGPLPPKHQALLNPEFKVVRSKIRDLNLPPFGKVMNRVEVLLGAEPIVGE